MNTSRLFKPLSALLLTIFAAGCDMESYQKLYAERCSEGKSVRVDQLNPGATCNGIPLLLALAKTPDLPFASQTADLLNYLISQAHFNPNVQEAGSGRTPLMVAIDTGNEAFAKEIFPYSDLNAADATGDTYLHHVARGSSGRFLFLLNAAALGRQGARRQTPLEAALEAKNYPFIWQMFVRTRKLDGLRTPVAQLSPALLFVPEAEAYPEALEAFAPLLDKPFTGVLHKGASQEKVSDYRLIHYAAENGFVNVVRLLISRGVSLNAVSSKSSPLAIAMRAARAAPAGPEHVRFEQTVDELMKSREAVEAPGVLNSAGQAENQVWLKRLMDAQVTLQNYEDLLTPGCFSAHSGSTVTGQSEADCIAYLLSPAEFEADRLLIFSGFERRMNRLASQLSERDIYGMAPVHYWLLSPHRPTTDPAVNVEQLRFLLKKMSQPERLNLNRDSVISLAVLSGRLELVRTAVQLTPGAPALARTPNRQGLTPIQLAEKFGLKDIYAYLQNLH